MPNPCAVVMLTRPNAASQAFWDLLPATIKSRTALVISPLLRIEGRDLVPQYGDVRGVIFTSQNAVDHAGPPQRIPAYCIGRVTTAAAVEAGWHAEQAGTDADSLVKTLINQRPKAPLVHAHGAHTRGNVAQRLTDAGLPTRAITVYDQHEQPLTEAAMQALDGTLPVISPLFSPRTARAFASHRTGGAPLHIVAMSNAVLAETASIAADSVTVASAPNAQAMLTAVEVALRWVEPGDTPS